MDLKLVIFHLYLYERFRGYSSSLFRCLSSFMFTLCCSAISWTLPFPVFPNTDINLIKELFVLFILLVHPKRSWTREHFIIKQLFSMRTYQWLCALVSSRGKRPVDKIQLLMSVAKQMVHHSLVASSHKTDGEGNRPLKMIVSISEKICIYNGKWTARGKKWKIDAQNCPFDMLLSCDHFGIFFWVDINE